MSLNPARHAHHFIVFVSYENERPAMEIAAQMIRELHLENSVAVGEDILLGGCEVRFFYDPQLLDQVRAYLDDQNVRYEITYL